MGIGFYSCDLVGPDLRRLTGQEFARGIDHLGIISNVGYHGDGQRRLSNERTSLCSARC